ncbi:unnamed protein product [Ambrosiozyma monospora]|uniref:Unnamed protein product n=1 Tax=Ambrosiozyma monospora TaxID=43982 RepID=A0ACB5SUT9_AMBMO|nr:unnamed protein product [Ambrosiozyma monospora]
MDVDDAAEDEPQEAEQEQREEQQEQEQNANIEKDAEKEKNEKEEEEYEDVYVSVVFPGAHSKPDNKKGDPSTSNRTVSAQKQSELEETIETHLERTADSHSLRISGLHKPQPLVQVQNQVFRGTWSNLVGTEMVFNENGERVGNVDGHIVLEGGKLVGDSSQKHSFFQNALNLAAKVEIEKKKRQEQLDLEERLESEKGTNEDNPEVVS